MRYAGITPTKKGKIMKTPKYKHPANPPRVEAENLRRRSHAAGSHDQGPHRERSRKASKDAAIKRDSL